MKIAVSVRDVDGALIKNCTLRHYEGGVVTVPLPSGEGVVDIPDGVNAVKFVATTREPHYFDEEVTVHRSGTLWDNPTCAVTSEGGQISAITFVLGRVRAAPSMFISESDLQRIHRGRQGIRHALREDRQPIWNWRYRLQWDGGGELRLLKPRILNDAMGEGWQRLHHEITSPDPVAKGAFRWLEYHVDGRMYAIAVWAQTPYFSRIIGTGLDFVVMLSPTTEKKDDYKLDPGQSYPYGLKRVGQELEQPFLTGLGQGYFFRHLPNHMLVHQLVAARKKALLVLPINNEGKFGPFKSGPGLHRALKEIARFVYKTHVVTPWFSMANKSDRFTRQGHYPSIPGVRQVVTVGYSEALGTILPLLNTADPSFAKVWTELWCLDLAVKGGTHFAELGPLLDRWLGKDNRRRLRLYQTAHTTSSAWRPSTEPRLKNIIGKATILTKQGASSSIAAEEIHAPDDRWSMLYFSYDYLKQKTADLGDPDPHYPHFYATNPKEKRDENGKVHDFVVKAMFGHAARLSRLADV
jgi:hypothetical protein